MERHPLALLPRSFLRRSPMRLRDIILASVFTLAPAAPAMADHIFMSGVLTGASEVPPTGSAATGTASIDIDTGAGTLKLVMVQYQGLGGTYQASHIHGPTNPPGTLTAPVRFGFVAPAAPWVFGGLGTGLPPGDSHAGQIQNFVITSPAVTAADISALMAGHMYVNIHSTAFPGGEIRADLQVDRVVPTATTPGGRVQCVY